MANSPSARKRIRQTARNTLRNVARRSRTRRFVRRLEEALSLSAVAGGKEVDQKAGKVAGKNADKKNAEKKITDKSSSNNDISATPSAISLEEHFRLAMSELHRAAQKGVMHRKTVARKVSRLAKRLKSVTLGDGGVEDAERGGKKGERSAGSSEKRSPKRA